MVKLHNNMASIITVSAVFPITVSPAWVRRVGGGQKLNIDIIFCCCSCCCSASCYSLDTYVYNIYVCIFIYMYIYNLLIY